MKTISITINEAKSEKDLLIKSISKIKGSQRKYVMDDLNAKFGIKLVDNNSTNKSTFDQMDDSLVAKIFKYYTDEYGL